MDRRVEITGERKRADEAPGPEAGAGQRAQGNREQPKLYDLSEDLAEANDFAAQFPDRVKALREAYEAWAKDLPKPLWNNDKSVE